MKDCIPSKLIRQLKETQKIMAEERTTAKQIIAKRRQVDVLAAQGKLVDEAVKPIVVTDTKSR